jgi:hypothetical protein
MPPAAIREFRSRGYGWFPFRWLKENVFHFEKSARNIVIALRRSREQRPTVLRVIRFHVRLPGSEQQLQQHRFIEGTISGHLAWASRLQPSYAVGPPLSQLSTSHGQPGTQFPPPERSSQPAYMFRKMSSW